MRISEKQFVELLAKNARQHARKFASSTTLRRGIGDDCAVIAQSGAGNDLLVTTDLFLENVHFRREWQEARSVGHKILARGLSDIAAMGGVPRHVFLSLGLPKRLQTGWVEEFFEGFFALAKSAKVVLAGGDTGASRSGFIGDVIVVGEVPSGQAVLRSGARPEDEIWVTGELGRAARGLERLQARSRARKQHAESDALDAFFYPQPRLRAGIYLRQRKLASSMMDISDGLSIDLFHLCKASGVAARIIDREIPHDEQTSSRHYLHGGEDLELLFTVPPERSREMPRSIAGVTLTRIGEIREFNRRKPRLLLTSNGHDSPLPVQGFQHF
ncbi:MAG: thiamine-phosphate kinase [Acidobacteria bacterium]|nr:thiamine-phosphate kinase [Acidobacteriota bacterium]